MRTETNLTVRANYPRYQAIGESLKTLAADDIWLHESPNHAKSQVGDVQLSLEGLSDNGRLNVSLNVEKMKSFGFKIFCDAFMPQPCYRFDSDGPFHTNPPADDVVLRKRRVNTPHFHRYNQEGQLMAYKTDDLVRDEKILVGDCQKAMRCFFQEENVLASKDAKIVSETLPLGVKDFEDPLEGVEFK